MLRTSEITDLSPIFHARRNSTVTLQFTSRQHVHSRTRTNMFPAPLTILLVVQAGCEWVEISQHYKKPMKPTHNHPLLATIERPSDGLRLTTVKYPSGTAVEKITEAERTTKRNRIYINNTLPDSNWNIGFGQYEPSSDVNIKTSVLFNENNAFAKRKPPVRDEVLLNEDKNRGDVFIIQKPKPNKSGNVIRTEKPVGHRASVAGNVVNVRPANKEKSDKIRPLDEYKQPIEVFNLADLEQTTGEDTINLQIDKNVEDSNYNRNQNGELKQPESNNFVDQRKPKPSHESTTKLPASLLGVTNMRRVEILRSTKPTPVEEFKDSSSGTLTSPKPATNIKSKTKSKDSETTPHRFPYIANVKRVNTNSTTGVKKPKPYKTVEAMDGENFTEPSEKLENNIRRIDKPNMSRRRSTTERTFSVKTKPDKPKIINDKVPDPEDVMLEELITEEEHQFDIKVHKVASIGNVKRVSNPTGEKKVNKNDVDNRYTTKKNTDSIPESENDEDAEIEDEESTEITDFTSNTEEVPILTTSKIKLKKNISTQRQDSKQFERREPDAHKHVKQKVSTHNFVTKKDNDKNEHFETTLEPKRNRIGTESFQENSKRQDVRTKGNSDKDINPQANEETNQENITEDPLSSDRKQNAMENLIKFLKTVTEIIARNTRRGVHGKMRYLEDLRDTIMANIEERLEAAFPDDVSESPESRRHARSAEPRGHVEFPSSEGALMTISFLTFAVFLIKLVMQVIQAYKNKTMMVMPTVVAAVGRAYTEGHNNR